MNSGRSIAKNIGVLTFAQIVSFFFSFFYVMYTGRYLGVEGFGILSFALAFTGILGVFPEFGLSTFTVREVARNNSLARKYIGNIAIIKSILYIVLFGLIALSINIFKYPEQTVKVIYIVALSTAFNSACNIFNSIFQAFEKMEYASVGNIFNSFLIFAAVLFAIYHKYDVTTFASIYLFASLIVLIYSYFVFSWKFFVPNIELDLDFSKSIMKQSWPFFLSAIVDIIAFKVDIIMISIMKGNIAVGYYSAAYKLLEALMFIPGIFATSIYPAISKFFISSPESLKMVYQKGFKYLLIIAFPIAVGTTLLADKIMLLIYKGEFVQSILALQILIWTIPFIFLSSLLGIMLASINRQKLAFKINIICMLLNVVINLILIPKYSFIGSSLATVITSLVSLILCYHFISKFIFKFALSKLITKTLLSNLVMALFIIYLMDINLSLLICIAIVIYFTMLFISGILSKEDLKLLKQIGV
jgi:O-antigen/teichoic acid export membrane protein